MEKFLQDFYETISFDLTTGFKSEQFRSFFLKDALLLEQGKDGCIHKSIEEHIKEFEDVTAQYPAMFEKGFHEHQIDCDIKADDNCYFVSSTYEKTYHKLNGEMLKETGVNQMMIINDQGVFKIACIYW